MPIVGRAAPFATSAAGTVRRTVLKPDAATSIPHYGIHSLIQISRATRPVARFVGRAD